jgi:hypothetical protein
MNPDMEDIILSSIITCPECGTHTEEQMPEDACQFFWQCPNCSEIIKPKRNDCCVFCSFGDTPCPPVQMNKNCS